MKELDLLLERYMRERYAGASPEERRAFRYLLELPDPVLAAYLLAGECPRESPLAGIVGRVTRLHESPAPARSPG